LKKFAQKNDVVPRLSHHYNTSHADFRLKFGAIVLALRSPSTCNACSYGPDVS